MSDPATPTYKPLLEFDALDPTGSACRALVSIANSLRILADETIDVSPIMGAAFTVAEGPHDFDPPSGPANGRGN